MKLAYSYFFIAVFFVVSLAPVSASKREFSKTIEKQFPITANGTTILSNRYGLIEIKTWERNEVKILVTVKVEEDNESKAKNILDGIDIQFENGSDFVKATTVINWTKGGNYKISYQVFMPSTNQLTANMNYGDLRAMEIKGKATVAVKYGNFYLDGVGDGSSLELAYGKGTLLKGVDIQSLISYSEIHLEQIQDLNINSKYSKVYVTKAADVSSESSYDNYDVGNIQDFKNIGKYDNLKIQQAENVRIISKYTHLKLENLRNSIDLEFSYGGASILNVAKGFSFVTLTGSYASFKINVADDATYRVEAEGEYGNFERPSDLSWTTDIQRSHGFEYKGYKGLSDARSLIKVKLRYGGLKIE